MRTSDKRSGGKPGSDPRLLVNIFGELGMNGRGGKREGAGRKPAPVGTIKVAYATKLTPEVIEFLRQCENASETIDDTLRKSKSFREWSKSR
jgi:hypothetical protein